MSNQFSTEKSKSSRTQKMSVEQYLQKKQTQRPKQTQLLDTGLKVLVPFLAGAAFTPGVMNAQCGNIPVVVASTAYGAPNINFGSYGSFLATFNSAYGLVVLGGNGGIVPFGVATGNFYSVYDVTPPLASGTAITGTALSVPSILNATLPADFYVGVIATATGNVGFVHILIDAAGVTTIDAASSGLGPAPVAPATVGTATAGDCTTLPVELIKFTSTPTKAGICLDWVTALEHDNAGFELQRSMDGVNFEKLAWLEGAGTNFGGKTYRYEDMEVKAGAEYYYRLRQMDYDGNESFSKVVTAKVAGEAQRVGEFFPNPSNGAHVNVELHLASEEKANIEIFNQNGQVVAQKYTEVESGRNLLSFDVSAFAAGVYYAKVTVDTQVEYRQIVVK